MKNQTYIIAEVGPNHNGSVEMAISYIKELSKIGVDAVKFQIANPELLLSKNAIKANYQKERDTSKSPLEMSKNNQLTKEEHILLSKKCKEYGIDYLSSAFDLQSLKFLDLRLDVGAFKIASGEILSIDSLEYISNRNKPIILSSGMASYNEIEYAIDTLNNNFKKEITILHCVSSYPVKAKDVNLSVMQILKEKFKYPVGFSDHTIDNLSSTVAVALGASIIEKHVTFDKSWNGPDHKASSTIEEFKCLVESIRKVEKLMGKPTKVLSESENEIKNVARKSIVAKVPIKKGQIIKEEDICYKRPGTGFLPIEKKLIIGAKAKDDIEADTLIHKNQIEI